MRKPPFFKCRFNSHSPAAVTYEAMVTWYYGYNALDRDEIQEEGREYFQRRVVVRAESSEEAEALILKDYPFVNAKVVQTKEVEGGKVLGGAVLRTVREVRADREEAE